MLWLCSISCPAPETGAANVSTQHLTVSEQLPPNCWVERTGLPVVVLFLMGFFPPRGGVLAQLWLSVGWAGALWMLQEQVRLSGSVQEPGRNTDPACHLTGPVRHPGTCAELSCSWKGDLQTALRGGKEGQRPSFYLCQHAPVPSLCSIILAHRQPVCSVSFIKCLLIYLFKF